MAKINGTTVETLVIKNALDSVLGTLSVTDDETTGIHQGTFTISAEDASTYATTEYTVSDITCDNGYIIMGRRQTTSGGICWMYTPLCSGHCYLNGSSMQATPVPISDPVDGVPYSKLVNKHPVIKGVNSSFPLVADTFDVLYW